MKYYIYKLTFQSGSTYIDQHTEKKENDGYISSSSYMKTNPEDKIIKREILIYVKDKETLDIMETLCIRADKCDNPKNVNKHYGNWYVKFIFKGLHHSEKTKNSLRKNSKKLWKNKNFREKVIKNRLGYKHSKETKELMSESAKSSWTEERKQKAILSGNYSHKHTEEQKKLFSEQKKGCKKINNGKIEKYLHNYEEYIKNGWIFGKLRKVTDETKQKMSEAAKKRPCNTKGKKKINKNGVGKFVSIEDLDKYLNNGWSLGLAPHRKKS